MQVHAYGGERPVRRQRQDRNRPEGRGATNDGMFICYAPADDPEIAIAIVVERGGSGANTAFIAKNILDAYYVIRGYSDSSEEEMALLK